MTVNATPERFTLDISAFVARARSNMDTLTRRVVLDVAKRIDQRSPVGDPELWAANDVTLMNRVMYQQFRADNGMAPVGGKTLAKKFKLKAPKGYIGGHFRANWQLGINIPPSGEIAAVDPTGAETQAIIAARIPAQAAGNVFYLVNNLPYAYRLEFEGWSSQAPNGMVGITLIEQQQIIDNAMKGIKP